MSLQCDTVTLLIKHPVYFENLSQQDRVPFEQTTQFTVTMSPSKMIIRLVSLTAVLLSYANCETDSVCEQISSSYLEVAVEFITKVKSNFSSCSNCEHEISSSYLDSAVDYITKAKSKIPSRIISEGNGSWNALDCSEWLEKGHYKSGVYTIWPKCRFIQDKPISVYCDMETDGGGWTVIQRRGPFGRDEDYFYKDWKSYKEGFGDLEKDFWLGNDNISALTNQKLYSVRFDLKDVGKDSRYAHYDTFWIDDEDHKYTLHIAGYTGDAGDSMGDKHNNQKFSARDQDNDSDTGRHCAALFKGGWWYNACVACNLNGMYRNGKYEGSVAYGVMWETFKGHWESLQSTEIKIRPKSFKLPQVSLDNTPK